jgi:hypothetical protein
LGNTEPAPIKKLANLAGLTVHTMAEALKPEHGLETLAI